MTLMIDGYNLIYMCDQWAEMMDKGDIEGARTRLISCLIQYQGAGKREIIVVFDGKERRPRGAGRAERAAGNISIMFTGGGREADDVIIQKVRGSENPSGITVVTSDRFIQKRVKRSGASVIESSDFRNEMFGRLKQAEYSCGGKEERSYPYISYEEYMRMLENHEKNTED